MDKAGKTYIQQVVGIVIYHARTIDMNMLHALNEIALQQMNPTKQTLLSVVQLLDYTATDPNVKIGF